MTLPTFLGIGAPRSGTTWLHELLDNHPQIFVPDRRKEVHFFDRHYDRGIGWYEAFFPSEALSHRFRAIGEITPRYLYCPQCPERIADVTSITKLTLILRNPIERVYSNYWFHVRLYSFGDTFEAFLSQQPQAIQRGFYSRFLKDFLRFFDQNQILVLIAEQAFDDVARTKKTLADFLDVDERLFAEQAGKTRVNRSYMPKMQRAFTLSAKTLKYLKERELYWAVKLARRFNIKRVFGEENNAKPQMQNETRYYLEDIYREDILDLEALLQINLDCWK